MEVLVAKSGGFCHGVKKAVDTALSVNPENTYIYGEIIHNKEVVDTITRRGIVTVESLSDVPDGATLIIRSHGAGNAFSTNVSRAESAWWTAPANLYVVRRRSSERHMRRGMWWSLWANRRIRR